MRTDGECSSAPWIGRWTGDDRVRASGDRMEEGAARNSDREGGRALAIGRALGSTRSRRIPRPPFPTETPVESRGDEEPKKAVTRRPRRKTAAPVPRPPDSFVADMI